MAGSLRSDRDARLPAALRAAVERAATPTTGRTALERLIETHPSLAAQLDDDTRAGEALVAVVSASRSLTRYLESSPGALDVLSNLDHRVPRADDTIDALVRWKQRELLRIAARDLIGLDSLEATTAQLATLAAGVFDAACVLASSDDRDGRDRRGADDLDDRAAAPDRLAVIGMGKLGGDELNYASDVDVIFVGEGRWEVLERRARAVIGIVRRCFRVDANLRPQGRDGPLVRTLESFEAYWHRWAEPWELQALLKARSIAGDVELGRQFLDRAQQVLWSHPFSADELRSLRQMKQRSESEVARKGLTDRDVKQGRGGIRDIEFTVQLLQLVHGHLDQELRGATTLPVLHEMATAGYIDPADATALADAYRFLRVLEHRLQLDDERQTHTVPDDPDALDRLARVVGYRDQPAASASAQLERALVRHQLTVRAIHERVYFRPLLEAFAGSNAALSPEAAEARLVAFGFTEAQRTRAAVRELTRGLNRSSRLMQQLLPLLLDWLSAAPDPDLGLLMLRNLLTGPLRTASLLETFRDSPDAAQRLCTIAGTSRLITDIVAHNPDLVARLPHTGGAPMPSRDELVASALHTTSWRPDIDERQAGLRRWTERNVVGVAARDILDRADVATIGPQLTTLAEASIEAGLAAIQPAVPFCVLALGRLGGAELSYASDLDIVFVYDGDAQLGPEARGRTHAEEGLRVASGLVRFLAGPTPADRIYQVDTDLRPEGKHGALARSVDGFVNYWRHYALVWERQAMIRARPVAGDRALGQRLLDTLDPLIWNDGLGEGELMEIRRMKARIERERIPFGEDAQFHLKLGRGSLSDVEFTAQLLQLRHGIRSTGTMHTLQLLAEAGALGRDDAEILMTSYRFCERTRNRWYLVNSKPGNSLPTAPHELLWLARSLDVTPTELRENYRRVTRRARRVVERVFYGLP